MKPSMFMLVTEKKPYRVKPKPIEYRALIETLVYRIGLRGFQEAFPDYHDQLDKKYRECFKMHSVQAAKADTIITDLIHQIIDLDPEVRLNALFKVFSHKKFSIADLKEIKKCFEEHKQKVYNGIEEP